MSKKKQSAGDVTHADLHQDEEMHVTRTTPQGTQEAGVDKGHELRDVKIRATLAWFFGLLVGTVITIGAMWVGMAMLAGRDRIEKNKISSPLYEVEHSKRTPELLPNIAQGVNQKMPWDHMNDFRKTENVELKKYGLQDGEGYAALPKQASDDVVNESRGATAPNASASNAAGDQEMPSESSGGQAEAIAILTK